MYKLLIWGTGKLAQYFIKNGCNGEVIGFIETNKSKCSYMDKPVYDSCEIPNIYDYIIVANTYATEIYDLCTARGMDTLKIIFLHGVNRREGCVDNTVIKSIMSEANYTLYCAEFGLTDDTFIKTDAEVYSKLNKRPRLSIQERYMYPIASDKYAPAGTIDNYFWQDLWAARLIVKSGVKSHFDIGSRLDGFIAHLLSASIDVTMIDIRNFPEQVEHLYTIVDDATSLHQITDESIESMSALCSLEHFGLGRYGDSVDPEACFRCFDNIQKKLKKGGRLYISMPVGKERVEFNAHRIFYPSTVIECFGSLHLREFSCTSQGKIEYNVDIHKYDDDTQKGALRYGLFLFVK
ncbi:hypothetical protein IMSAGC011_01422 [Lachnospiraceae bacterium]|nr:hypothetical protein IMSAGC011_01422 [Lachnospiraceae bacterium]